MQFAAGVREHREAIIAFFVGVFAHFESAGFELVGTNDINANPSDVPGADDIVWRLPPSLATSKKDPELQAELQAIGESDRMTLLFRKAP